MALQIKLDGIKATNKRFVKKSTTVNDIIHKGTRKAANAFKKLLNKRIRARKYSKAKGNKGGWGPGHSTPTSMTKLVKMHTSGKGKWTVDVQELGDGMPNMKWLEYGTKAHFIPRKAGVKRGEGPGVEHHGTKPQRVFSRTKIYFKNKVFPKMVKKWEETLRDKTGGKDSPLRMGATIDVEQMEDY